MNQARTQASSVPRPIFANIYGLLRSNIARRRSCLGRWTTKASVPRLQKTPTRRAMLNMQLSLLTMGKSYTPADFQFREIGQKELDKRSAPSLVTSLRDARSIPCARIHGS
jgi:hypothetical protein